MISLVVGLPAQPASSGASASKQQTSPVSTQAFESQLSEAISEVLAKFGMDSGSVKLTVQDSADLNVVTSQNPAAASSPFSTPLSPSRVPVSETAVASDPVTSEQSFNDSYWSKQPAAVQQMRALQDAGEKALLGTQLASEGYAIDVPIMVWGWDPGITTQLRQSYGYTWVPSALQQPVPEAPGIYTAGLTPYDPAHPPAGSIKV